MAARGHKVGIISTYLHTWILEWNVQTEILSISDPLSYDSKASDTSISVVQVLVYIHKNRRGPRLLTSKSRSP